MVWMSDMLEPIQGKQYRVESNLLKGQALNKVNCKKNSLNRKVLFSNENFYLENFDCTVTS